MPYLAAIYGFTFGICLLTRITNGVTVGVGVLLISILLIVNKEYFNLLKNAFYFIKGFLIIVLPFLLYFMFYGALGELFYAMLGYNFEYQSHMSSWMVNSTGQDWVRFALLYFTSYSIFLTALLAFLRKKYCLTFYCILCGILESYLFLSGALFSQYAIIVLPQFLLLLNEIVILSEGNYGVSAVKVMLLTAIVIFSYVSLGSFITKPADMHNKYKNYNKIGYESLLNLIPKEELNSFVAYGDNDLKTFYLLHNLLPCYKYFSIQEWHSSFSQYLKNDIHETFEEGDALWILIGNNADNINDILEMRYSLIAEEGKYKLYHLQ